MASVDNFWLTLQWFAFGIFLITMLVFWNAVTNVPDLWTESSVGTEIQGNAQRMVNTWDFVGVIAYFGMHLGIIVMAYLLRTHPVVMIAAIFLTAILAMVAAPLSNAWEDVTAEAELSTAAVTTNIPKVNFIMTQLPKFEVIWCILTMIVMFGFARSEGYI